MNKILIIFGSNQKKKEVMNKLKNTKYSNCGTMVVGFGFLKPNYQNFNEEWEVNPVLINNEKITTEKALSRKLASYSAYISFLDEDTLGSWALSSIFDAAAQGNNLIRRIVANKVLKAIESGDPEESIRESKPISKEYINKAEVGKMWMYFHWRIAKEMSERGILPKDNFKSNFKQVISFKYILNIIKDTPLELEEILSSMEKENIGRVFTRSESIENLIHLKLISRGEKYKITKKGIEVSNSLSKTHIGGPLESRIINKVREGGFEAAKKYLELELKQHSAYKIISKATLTTLLLSGLLLTGTLFQEDKTLSDTILSAIFSIFGVGVFFAQMNELRTHIRIIKETK